MKKTIHYQKRDIAILQALGLVVLMDVTMLRQWFFPKDNTGEACRRRMRLLLAHGLIARLSFPLVSITDEPGQLITLYRLTPVGAQLLAEITGLMPKRVLRTDPRPQTLLHRRDLAQVVLGCNAAAAHAGLSEPEWILEQDQRPGVIADDAPRAERFILYEDLKNDKGEIVKLRPDASCWLRFPDRGTWHDLLVWWEIDRATESLSQVCDKLAAFNIFLHQQERIDCKRRLYRRHWPAVENATLRVFFVCPSHQRIDNLRDAMKQIAGAEFIRFAVMNTLTPDRFLRDTIWQDVASHWRAIYPAAVPTS